MNYDIGQPWSIASLTGKYYGTEILDRNGQLVMSVWHIPWTDEEGSKPSEREPEGLEICDSHYECVASYEIAKAIVERING